MIDAETISSVVAQYERFGWKLERILLSEISTTVSAVFPDVPVAPSSQDALWFSRKSGHGIAWELRRLSGTPFALVRVLAPDASDEDREMLLKSVEAEMLERDVKTTGEFSNGK